MRIGLLADIHANQPALEAVLADLPDIDQLVCLGDIVGYNPMPAACVELVRDHADVVVQGNHDRLIERPLQMTGNRMAREGLEYAHSQLSAEQRQWLQTLPRIAYINGSYLTVHDHPTEQDTYVLPDDVNSLSGTLDEYSGVCLGHTHIQNVSRVDGKLVVNPGSVGQPRDGSPTAAYAVLDTETGEVDLRRTHYDVDRVHHEVVVSDLPTDTGERLFEGR